MTDKKKSLSQNISSPKRTYGWIPDRPDQRDYLLSAIQKVPAKLPAKVDLRPLCSKVEDQGQLGSCTANALAGALEFLECKDKVLFKDFSRLFIYYNERVIEHTTNADSGAMLRDGIKTLVKQGACFEVSWPYQIAKYKIKPSANCYQEALRHCITSYFRITTVDQMRTCLAEGFPFVFGFTVYESFESQEVARTGIVNLPKRNERALGGHAVMAVGYDHSKQLFIVRNSWGEDWGIKGYFTLPYKYLRNRNLSDDFWTIRRGELTISKKNRPGRSI